MSSPILSPLSERMNQIAALLASRLPARIVTRSLKDFAERQPAELKRGIYTLISQGESGYANYLTRMAMDGTQRLLLVGQIQLGEQDAPQAVEDAELAMVEEIKEFCRDLPPALVCLSMTGFTQSGQLEAPYGWVGINLEFMQ